MAKYIPLKMTVDEFLALESSNRTTERCSHEYDNAQWIQTTGEGLEAKWIVVGSHTGKVYKHGTDETPTDEEFESLIQELGEIPFVFNVADTYNKMY